MRIKAGRGGLLAVAIIGICLTAQTVHADSKPEKGKQYDNWGIDCETTPDGKSQKCFATQGAFLKETGNQLLRFSVGYLGPKAEVVAVAQLPLGISLQAGAAFKIDDAPQVILVIQNCTQAGCMASAVLNEAILKEMQTGKAMAVAILPMGAQQPLNIPISLKGFKSAFTSLK